MLASSLGDGAQAIQRTCLGTLRTNPPRLFQTLRIASERGFGFALLPKHSSLPPQNLGKERVEAVLGKLRQGVIVETDGLPVLLQLLCHPGHFDQQMRAFYTIGFLNHVDRPDLRKKIPRSSSGPVVDQSEASMYLEKWLRYQVSTSAFPSFFDE